MRFGYFATYIRAEPDKPLHQVYRDAAEQVECADAVGFDIVWFPEHHFTHHYCAPNPLLNIVDMARLTKRARLGTSVLVAPFHNPLIMAEEIGMADHLVEGRLEIGFARGSSLYEYDRFGITEVQAAERLRESLDILSGLWKADEDFQYQGKHFQFPSTYIVPRPFQAPHPPIWIAARTPDTLRFCIDRGFGIHTTPLRQPMSAFLTTMNTINATLEEYEASVRPPIAVQTETFISESWDSVMRAMKMLERNHIRAQNFARNRRPPSRGYGSLEPLPEGMQITAEQLAERSVVGNVEVCMQKLRQYLATGVEEFIAVMDFGQPQREILRSIEEFGTKVIPMCRELMPETAQARERREVRAGASERRRALIELAERQYGSGWQAWVVSDWLAYFETRWAKGDRTPYALFDFSVAPKNVRADAAGVVQEDGRLFLLRDQTCPDCGRPVLAVCYRPNGETPQQMREAILHDKNRPSWHATHP